MRDTFVHSEPPTDFVVYEGCNGDCDQGRNCPARQACVLPEVGPSRLGMRVVPWVGGAVFVLVVAGLAAGVFEDGFWARGPFASAPSSAAQSNTADAFSVTTHGEK